VRPNERHVLELETTNKPLKGDNRNETAETNETKPSKQSEKPLSLLKANREHANLSVILADRNVIQANRSAGLQSPQLQITLSNHDHGFFCFVGFVSFPIYWQFR